MPPQNGGTAAVFLAAQQGNISNVTVNNNLLAGEASYTLYAVEGNGQMTGIVITNNYIERGIYGYINVVGNTPTITNNVQWQEGVNPTPYPSSPGSPTPPAAPTIASFSNDSGVVGDRITNDNTLALTGAATANSSVRVFDGSALASVPRRGDCACTTPLMPFCSSRQPPSAKRLI